MYKRYKKTKGRRGRPARPWARPWARAPPGRAGRLRRRMVFCIYLYPARRRRTGRSPGQRGSWLTHAKFYCFSGGCNTAPYLVRILCKNMFCIIDSEKI